MNFFQHIIKTNMFKSFQQKEPADVFQVFKCPFREQCEITVLSRRFCQKCRLRKCLEVGMLTDLIMTTRGEKSTNGTNGCAMKIRKRRRHRDSSNSFGTSYNYDTNATKILHTNESINSYRSSTTTEQLQESPPVVPQYATLDRYPKIETDQWHNSGQFCSSGPMPMLPEYFDYEYDYQRPNFCSPDTVGPVEFTEERFDFKYEDRKPSLMALSDYNMETDTALMPYNSSASNSSNSDCNESNWRPVQTLSDTMITKTKFNPMINFGFEEEWAPVCLDFSTSLSACKMFRLEELLSANEIMAAPNRGPPISFADSSLAEHMGEVCIRRCIQVSRRIQAFRNLSAFDQITLLKGAATELMALRGLMVYQPHVDSWRPIGFPHRYLRLECNREYNRLRKFYSRFPCEWRTNEPMMLCISSIILFDPTQINLKDRKAVQAEQQFYYDLLKEYLKSVYPNADEIFWRLCQFVTMLKQKVHKLTPILQVEFDPQNMEIITLRYNWKNNCIVHNDIKQEEGHTGLTICPIDD